MCLVFLNLKFIIMKRQRLSDKIVLNNKKERKTEMEIGSKIRELRILNGLTQEELADRSELSKGFISQLENDLTSPSISTLEDILQCLGMSLNEFFSMEQTKVQVVFGDEDFFEKVDEQLKNKTEWIIPNAQKNMMEPIRLTLEACLLYTSRCV